MSTWVHLVIFTLLNILIGSALSFDVPPVLTEERRIRIFGTNTSTDLPTMEVVHIELLNKDDIKPFRKRPPKILQYRTTINDEDLTLSLRQNRDFIAPGCLVHHVDINGKKRLSPCFNQSRHCYYTGRSMNHNDSWVAASVCGGLRGALVYGNTTLIISPLENTDYPDFGHVIKHVVYKYKGEKQHCSADYPTGRVLYPPQTRQRRDTTGQHTPPQSRQRRDARRHFMEASRMYANHRTGQDIELVITSIHKYDSYQYLNIERTEDAQKLLDGFCEWKSSQPDKSLKTDATIYLTKVDIAYDGNEYTTGLARNSGMCSEKQNCALIEDVGPVMGYTIAHEIGHLLSLRHDGPNTPCGSSIMNAQGTSGRAASTWSNCSKVALEDFLSLNKSHCLLNKPAGYDVTHGHYDTDHDLPLPGVLYTADEQCQFIYGTNASLCPYEVFADVLKPKYNLSNPCEQLFCRASDTAMCYLTSFPLVDGTDINNTRTWCIRGEPMAMTDTDNTPPINGGWSEWSTVWSTCTQTCGGGVKIRRRRCNNPMPQFGGKQCPGSDSKAIMCNFQKCLKTQKEVTCSEMDTRTFTNYPNMTFSFQPYLGSAGDASCKVQCQGHSTMTNDIVFLNETYRNFPDGAGCRRNEAVPFTRCVDGKCRGFGCDGHSDSGLMFDNCGRCNGTGLGCTTVTGTYNRDGPDLEYETFLVLPKGTAGITINQTNGYCFLNVLVDNETALNASGYAHTGVYLYNGIRIMYTKYPEQIRIVEPLPSEIRVQVYRKYDYRSFANVSPSIKYEYNEATSSVPAPYTWSILLTQCSKSCGSGIATPIVTCWSLTGPVADAYCEITDKPSEMPTPCNDHPCPPRWYTSVWSQCSVTCGNGTRTRSVECIQENNRIKKVMPPTQCSTTSRPVDGEVCYAGRCPSVWIASDWSPCSKTCGDGIQSREIHCYDYRNISNRAPVFECDVNKKPPKYGQCQGDPCRLDIVGTNCTDIQPNCADYGSDICVGEYQLWAEKNCMKFCRICDACEDHESCTTYLKIDPAFCRTNPVAKVHCRRLCKYCQSCPDDIHDVITDCSVYDRKYCTDIRYVAFMQANCERYCRC